MSMDRNLEHDLSIALGQIHKLGVRVVELEKHICEAREIIEWLLHDYVPAKVVERAEKWLEEGK